MAGTAVIFDLDGTLLDTLEDLGDATNTALAQLGFPQHPIPDYRRMVGWGLRVLVTEALPQRSRTAELVESAQAAVSLFLGDHPVTKTHPYPGVPELLSALERAKVPMGILTNKPDGLTQLVVERLLGRWSFTGVHGQRDGVPRKPDPTVALSLAAEMEAAPRDTLFLGDSDVDMETARAAGMRPIGAAWGFRGAEELRAAGAERVIDAPLALLALLGIS